LASLRKTPTPNIPQVKIDGVEATPDLAVSAELPDAAHEYEKEITTADEASAVLKRQIEALEQSEQLQRQYAERQHQHTQHMNQLAEFAASEADKQGHERGTDGHLSAAREIFQNYLAHLQAQAQAAAAPQPTPQSIPRPSLPPLPPELPSSVSHFSAPVSREAPTASGQRTSASRITLTKEEKDMARIAGVSEVEYAKQKGRLIEEKNSGNYGEHRYR
jgi:hypothetical protein